MTQPLIVVIEPDEALQRLLCARLANAGCATIGWQRALGAHALIRREHPDAVLLDMRLEDAGAGLRLVEELRYDPDMIGMPVILLRTDAPPRWEYGETLAASGNAVSAPPFNLSNILTEALANITAV